MFDKVDFDGARVNSGHIWVILTDDFKGMIIACTRRPSMIASLILPATAFSKMNYTIRNVGVKEPIVQIKHEKEEYAVGSVFNNGDDRFVERAYSFAYEEEGCKENKDIEL